MFPPEMMATRHPRQRGDRDRARAFGDDPLVQRERRNLAFADDDDLVEAHDDESRCGRSAKRDVTAADCPRPSRGEARIFALSIDFGRRLVTRATPFPARSPAPAPRR